MFSAALHGFWLAFGLILPLGAQNTFLLTQGALHRRWAGPLPALITAGLCDTLLILAAVSGISLMVVAIPWLTVGLSWAGVLFLAYIGWVTWRSEPGAQQEAGERWSAGRQVAFALSVSLLNPHALLDTVAVVGTSALSYTGSSRLAFTFATVSVSWLYFLALVTAGHLLGSASWGARFQRRLNRISALIIWAVGFQFLRSLL